MRRAPQRHVVRLACLCLLVFALTGVVTAVSPVHSERSTLSCERDSYTPPELDQESDLTLTDELENGSLDNWSGGRLARVGAEGGCSLVVTANQSVTLTATTVNGTSGVVTGVLDLGSNGSLLLEANDSQQHVVISTQGPDFAHNYSVTVGEESSEQTLSTGRFFEFAVVLDNGTTQITLWEAGDQWDGEFDASVTTRQTDDLRLRLDGTAFLDGVAVGVEQPPESAETPTESQAGVGRDETGSEDQTGEDPLGDVGPPADEDTAQSTEPDDGGGGALVLGLFLLIGGGVWFRFARGVARLEEQFDSIGSKRRWSEVEPAEWKVALNKVFGACAVIVGLFVIGTGLLGG